MRKASVLLVGACVLVAALYFIMSKGGGSGGRGERRASGTADEPAAMPERPVPAPPTQTLAPRAPPWRAVGDAKVAARGAVDVLLALDYGERAIARGVLADGTFAIDLPFVGDLPPVLLRRAKLVAKVAAPGFLPARSAEVALKDREPGDIRLDLALEAGACVRGRVVDAAARPADDAEVWLSPRDPNAWDTSDPEGRFALPLRVPGEYWLCARKGDIGVAARGPLRLSPLGDFDAGDLVLAGPGVLSGVATYPDGTPARRLDLHAVPAALVGEEITSWPDAPFDAAKDGPPTGLAWGWTTTDDEGRFLIRGLRAGSYFFREDRARAVFETGIDVRVVVDLYRIRVRIVDERGTPAALDASARSDSGSSAAGRIDDIAVRPGERWTVTIGDLDLAPAVAIVDIVRDRREYDVTLVARTPLEFARAQVTLLDPRGDPFPAVRVSLDALPGDNVILLEEKLDAEACTPEVPVGHYRVEARPADRLAPYFPAAVEADLRAGAVTPVRLTARAGGRVQVTFEVTGDAAPHELSDVLVEARPTQGGDAVRLVRFVVKDDGGYTIGGRWAIGERASGWQLLEPGQYEIHIRAKGYRRLVVPALVLAEQVTAIDAVLEAEDR
ncbi:MAG TPA: hypothetical protein VFY93_11090 [Planctomycetota bacterium]|nr:hypothetical protein [Planctomycetota bacterium]